MGKANVMTIRVPEELKERIEKTASLQGVSINQFALYAFKKYLKGKKREDVIRDFDFLMTKIPGREVPDRTASERYVTSVFAISMTST